MLELWKMLILSACLKIVKNWYLVYNNICIGIGCKVNEKEKLIKEMGTSVREFGARENMVLAGGKAVCGGSD